MLPTVARNATADLVSLVIPTVVVAKFLVLPVNPILADLEHSVSSLRKDIACVGVLMELEVILQVLPGVGDTNVA